MLKKFALAVGMSVVTLSAFAFSNDPIVKSVELKDGATVHVFRDGKMAMEGVYGRVESMADGHVMEAKNGDKIVMKGNETARLSSVLRTQYLN